MSNFSIATDRSWKDKQTGEWKTETDWHNIVLWGSEKLMQSVRKGAKVAIEGRLQTRSYEHAGMKKYVTEVVADSLVLCDGGKQDSYEPPVSAPRAAAAPAFDAVSDDDVPW